MMLKRWFLLMVVAMLFWVVFPAHAGWIMLEQSGDKTLISNGRLKSTSEGFSSIFNGPKNEMIFISDSQKIYWRGTADEYCSGTAAMFEQVMKGMPEEQRQMMKQMMAKGSQDSERKVAVVKDGEGGTIAGLKTMKYNVLVDNELVEEVWLTTDAALMKEFKPLVPMLQKFNACIGSMDMEFTLEKSPEYQKLWETGFQLKSVRHEYGNAQTETDVAELKKADIPDQEFEAPAGYQKRSFAEIMQSQME